MLKMIFTGAASLAVALAAVPADKITSLPGWPATEQVSGVAPAPLQEGRPPGTERFLRSYMQHPDSSLPTGNRSVEAEVLAVLDAVDLRHGSGRPSNAAEGGGMRD